MLFIVSSFVAALLLDRIVGEPQKFHPLVFWAKSASTIEKKLNSNQSDTAKIRGVIAWLCAVILPAVALYILLGLLIAGEQMEWQWLLSTLCLYVAVGWQSLREHGWAVAQALQQDIDSARAAVSRMVSRNTETMDEPAVVRGVLESLLENGADAIYAPIFWYLVAGPVGVVVYRLANTLDAMWGYKTPRYKAFGWFSAKADDWLNWLPARLTAISYALLGKTAGALNSWRKQAPLCASPNGGPVMCAGAGSLNVLLGGPTMYHGEWQDKVIMGCGEQPQPGDINRAIRLIDRTVYSWVVIVIIIALCS